MDTAKKFLSVYLVAVATAVGLHFMFESFYRGANTALVWDVLNWFMAVAVVASLIVRCVEKAAFDREARGDSDVYWLRALRFDVALCAALVLTLWYFWNWTYNLAGGSAGDSTTRSVLWVLIDPLFVLVAGCHVWRGAR